MILVVLVARTERSVLREFFSLLPELRFAPYGLPVCAGGTPAFPGAEVSVGPLKPIAPRSQQANEGRLGCGGGKKREARRPAAEADTLGTRVPKACDSNAVEEQLPPPPAENSHAPAGEGSQVRPLVQASEVAGG